MLKDEAEKACGDFHLETTITKVERVSEDGVNRYRVETNEGNYLNHSLVVATGGLSLLKLGATGLGYEIARQFKHKIVETKPALDGFTFSGTETPFFTKLAGLSCDCILTAGDLPFRENILFTHTGLSGHAALQGSLHWNHGETIEIILWPDENLSELLKAKKKEKNLSLVKMFLSEKLPERLAEAIVERDGLTGLNLNQLNEKQIALLATNIQSWTLKPKTTVGYNKAEVTKDGVDTHDVSSKTMESIQSPGLYFIGEVLDVTGWLGGYNFQWAWASGWAAGISV